MVLNKNIKFLVVHCSDTENNENLNAADIHIMHLGFGWDGIGYHKIITRSGEIENGRPEFWVGAHVKGLNSESIGVCLIGRDIFTNKQFISLKKILKIWKKKYPHASIVGHYNLGNTKKTCPNFNVIEWATKQKL